MCVCVCINIYNLSTYQKIYVKELASMAEVFGADWQDGTQAGFLCYSLDTEYLLLQETSVYVLEAFN